MTMNISLLVCSRLLKLGKILERRLQFFSFFLFQNLFITSRKLLIENSEGNTRFYIAKALITLPLSSELKVMNHFLGHHNIKCLDTIPLYKIIFAKLFELLGMRNLILSSLNTAQSYPFSFIKNILLKKNVSFSSSYIMNHLK